MTRSHLLVFAGVLVGSAVTALLINLPTSRALAQDKPATPPQTVQDITLEQAHKVLEAAVKKAQDLKIKQNVAVVDAGGSLKAFVRMDGAWIGSIDIAQKKAKTARYFDMNTGDIGKLSQPGGPLYMIEVSNQGLITFPGGVPLKTSDGKIIGAVGVSGSTVDNDQACAEAGAGVIK